MKLRHLLYVTLATFATISCSDWTEIERDTFPEQESIDRNIPFLEAQTEADLKPALREHYRKLREEYRPSPHVKGFGWFGNWTGKGSNEQNYLKCLPDSLDFVSLWGIRGNLSEEQKTDLKFFQEVKGCQALLCWIVQDIGSAITPAGEDMHKYWLERANNDELEATKLYANAIADTVIKYNLDGFDIDYEPRYGHSGTLANTQQIADSKDQNQKMYWFIKTLYDRFQAHEQETGKQMLLVMDGEPYRCSAETSEMLDYYIFQAYWDRNTTKITQKFTYGNYLVDKARKTILTVEFEQCWRTGGIHPDSGSANYQGKRAYISTAHPEFNDKHGGQIFEYATFDFNGQRIGGVGAYHIEYDYKNDPPYKWIRAALYMGNQKYPGNFE